MVREDVSVHSSWDMLLYYLSIYLSIYKLWGLINNKKLLLTVLELRSPRSRLHPAHSLSGESQIPGWKAIFFVCPYMAEGIKKLSVVSFMKILFPFMRALFSKPNHFPESATSKCQHTRKIGSTYDLGKK